jgi:flagellar hook-associated protein 2
MGTVGLSFGSPTSGTGFDVSTTVASIVSNLQNVETPWKTQLTSLQSQDTAISSLGTLMSSLSNDISQLTDFTGIMAQKTGSSSDTGVLELTAASSSAVAGTHTVVVNSLAKTSSGYLTAITNASDELSGSITLKVGSSGTAQTIDVDTLSNKTLAGLAAAINSSGAGVTASVLTDSSGSRLSLVSGTSGANGNITVSANSIADSTTSSGTLAYNPMVTGADASLTVDGVALTSSSNTVTNLIPGLTFQLLAPSAKESDSSLEEVQVVIANDNTAVESTINTLVSDYNSLISAVNTQEGNDSSGNPEPLYGSPTLSLLQQQLMSSLNTQNPNGTLDAIANNTGTTLSGSMTIAVGGGTVKTITVGSAPSGGAAANTIYTGSGSGYNTLSGLAAAINAANTDLSYSDTGYTTDGTNLDTGAVGPVANGDDTLTGSLSISVGGGTAQTITLGSSGGTLQNFADAINGTSGIGVTASVVANSDGTSSLSLVSQTAGTAGALQVTSYLADGIGAAASVITQGTQSTLSLLSQTAGSSGALTVSSSIKATSDTLLSYSGTAGTSAATSTGTLTSIAAAGDTLTGSLSIQVGGGAAQTVTLGASGGTLQDLADAINNTANIGVKAVVGEDSNGLPSLSLTSLTPGSDGTLTVTSNILDTANPSTANLSYTNSSDLSSLANLGITVSTKDDGSLTFDAATLDSALNSDFSGAVGFFQGVDSWGMTFSSMLENAGSSSSTGILALAASANSSSESTLNADISKEESQISIQQKSLTAELTSANEIMQQLPSQLEGVNELYSAITGYNQSK